MRRLALGLLILIALPLLVLGVAPTPCIASDPIYLDCKYEDELVKDHRVVITIDLEAKNIRWEDFYKSGKSEQTYPIVSSSDSEVKGRRMNYPTWEITLNRINGRWLIEFPIDRSSNPELWDPEKGMFPYPLEAQIRGSFGGWCKVTKPKF